MYINNVIGITVNQLTSEIEIDIQLDDVEEITEQVTVDSNKCELVVIDTNTVRIDNK